MERIFQGIGSGSYLDAARLDRLVDRLVRALNGGLYASALAPTYRVPNAAMKENGAVLALRGNLRSNPQILGLVPAAARVGYVALYNTTASLVRGIFSVGDASPRWKRLVELPAGGYFLESVDGLSLVSGTLVRAFPPAPLAGVIAQVGMFLEHVA